LQGWYRKSQKRCRTVQPVQMTDNISKIIELNNEAKDQHFRRLKKLAIKQTNQNIDVETHPLNVQKNVTLRQEHILDDLAKSAKILNTIN